MRTLFVLGRVVFGGFFLVSGLNHFSGRKQLSAQAASKSVLAADAAVRATGAMLVAGGASVVAGVKPRRGLATLVAFLVPVSLQIHRFWDIDDPERRNNEMVHFMKNMALVGAALAMMEIDEPWPASLTGGREQSDELYVRVGGREIRALPY